MIKNTYMQAVLDKGKIKTNQQLLQAFAKFAACFKDPQFGSVETVTKKGDKLTYQKSNRKITLKDAQNFLERMLEENKEPELVSIHAYGAIRLNPKKRRIPLDELHVFKTRRAITYTKAPDGKEERKEIWLNEPEIFWSRQDQIMPERKKLNGTQKKERVTEINEITKKIIREFNPEMLSFDSEYGCYLHDSSTIYFKNPYLFLIEFPRNRFLLSEEIEKTAGLIKKALPIEELTATFKKILEESEHFKILQTKQGGLGVLQKQHKIPQYRKGRDTYVLPHAITELRQKIRKKGLNLPTGDIEKKDFLYHERRNEYIEDYRLKNRKGGGLYLKVVLGKGKIKDGKQLVETFLKTLTLLKNQHPLLKIASNMTSTSPILQHREEVGGHLPIEETKEQVKIMLEKEQAGQNARLSYIDCSGSIMFDHESCLFPADRLLISLGRRTFRLIPSADDIETRKEEYVDEPIIELSLYGASYYGFSGEKEYKENYRAFFAAFTEEREKTRIRLIAEIVSEIHKIAKDLICEFDPVMLSLHAGDAEYLHQSAILYFKDPYLFCLEFLTDGFLLDDEAKKKIQQIKKVISLEELMRTIKESLTSSELAEVFQTKNGGFGIFRRWDKISQSKNHQNIMPHILTKLRQKIRRQGVKLPAGNIERMDTIYHARRGEYLKQSKKLK